MSQETKAGIAVGLLFVVFMVAVAMFAREIGATAERYAECRKDNGQAPDVCFAESLR